MSFFKKLFGGGTPPSEPGVRPPNEAELPQPQDPSQDPNMIRVFDAYGREMFITRQDWLNNVLRGNLEKHWNEPEQLSGLIIQSFNDGFFPEMVQPAERLLQIDPNHERAAVLLGIVYLKVNRLADSERILRQHAQQYGESGVVLTNIAKVCAGRGDEAGALENLWRGLQRDPNQDNAVGWYEVIHREKNGEAAGEEALRRIAALPGSWRAQLWLARNALKHRDLPAALSLYHESLAAAPSPAPLELLQQMSGDLGNAGHLPEVLNLTLPQFDVAFHGLAVGNNLIKAMLDLGQVAPAREILHQLYAQNRPDWKQTLSFWDTEIAKLNVETTAAEPEKKLSVAMLPIEGAVWLPAQSPAHELFPSPARDAVRFCFLGSTAETGQKPQHAERQMSDAPGWLSRALPLFLAEQVRFNAGVNVRTLVPWIRNPPGGFVLSGVAWKNDSAAHYARMADEPCDYIIITHLKTAVEPWSAELRLIRTIDAKCLGITEASFRVTQTGEAAQDIVRELLTLLTRHAEVDLASPARHYVVPAATDLAFYLLRLEQLLAVRCAGMDGVSPGFLSGEREIIDGNIQLCLNNVTNPTTRILLLQTMKAMKRVRPEIRGEYSDKLEMLQREHPLGEPAQCVCQRLLDEVLAV